MKPILLIHGYSSEGKKSSAKDIYGSLPRDLREAFGNGVVQELDLSRWISLSDGVRIDDVSFAMDRALKARFANLLSTGFHVVIHSTGALVVRNWIKNHSPKPCPIENFVHLAGANFGSGLAHIGQGQLSRWGRLLFLHTGRGHHVLNELEFGSWKSLDMHRFFLEPAQDMYRDYEVQEFCVIGSHIERPLRAIPIRYIKEDSSDNTVRTSACNLNFNYVPIKARPEAFKLSHAKLKELIDSRQANQSIVDTNYQSDQSFMQSHRQKVPFAVAYETSHFGDGVGIVSGEKNRKQIVPLLKAALETPYDTLAYAKVAAKFEKTTERTFARVAKLKAKLTKWDRQSQYEAHSQLIIRVKDQYGRGVRDFDITFKSTSVGTKTPLETLIEDRHDNRQNDGTATFYFRTQEFSTKKKIWQDRLANIAPMHLEITGEETDSPDIEFIPLDIQFSAQELKNMFKHFQTTILDIELVRLPKRAVFSIKKT
ncbi:MAG: hypothetical protein ACI9JM_000411 [Halioglobus sp.]|jgi:hypothetical protein